MPTPGHATEAAVLRAFVELGWDVLVPWRADSAYDLVVSPDGARFVRVQCKSGRERDGCVIFNCHSTDHGRGPRLYHDRADVFAIWCPTIDQIFALDIGDVGPRSGRLRLTPARNNQLQRVRWAADHTLERWAMRRSP